MRNMIKENNALLPLQMKQHWWHWCTFITSRHAAKVEVAILLVKSPSERIHPHQNTRLFFTALVFLPALQYI